MQEDTPDILILDRGDLVTVNQVQYRVAEIHGMVDDDGDGLIVLTREIK